MYIEDNLINPDEIRLEEDQEGRADLLPQKLAKIEDSDHKSRYNKCMCQNAIIWEGSFLDLERLHPPNKSLCEDTWVRPKEEDALSQSWFGVNDAAGLFSFINVLHLSVTGDLVQVVVLDYELTQKLVYY